MAAVTHEGMSRYVATQLEPVWDHITKHDEWHRDRLVDEVKIAQNSGKAAVRSLITGLLAFAGVALSAIDLISRHVG